MEEEEKLHDEVVREAEYSYDELVKELEEAKFSGTKEEAIKIEEELELLK